MATVLSRRPGGGGGGAPSGPAGGDLTGTYPNPTLAAGAVLFDAYAIWQHQETAGTNGGVADAAGAFRTRELNTEVEDSSGIGVLAANQVTLQAGKYAVRAQAQHQNTGLLRLRVQDVTNGTTLALGNNFIQNTVNTQINPTLSGVFTLAGAAAIELQYRLGAAGGNSSDLGDATNWGVAEIYASLEIWRYAS